MIMITPEIDDQPRTVSIVRASPRHRDRLQGVHHV